MTIIKPKRNINRLRLRDKAVGTERRLNMTKLILDKGTPFPKPVGYDDIDKEFEKWVNESLNIEFAGKRIPTIKLFSNQRINDYAQPWKHLDENGNVLMNFKAITRETNPQQGSGQGGFFNNSMKQPFSVDFKYTVTIVTNQYQLLNKMNELVHYNFQALQCYISPNDHPMPLTLDSVSDESEYSIDDRNYYSQSFTILLKGYIIRKEDFQVTHIPSRQKYRFVGDKHKRKGSLVEIEDDERFKFITITVTLNGCTKETEFTIDCDFILDTIETSNTYDFVILCNEEKVNLEANEIRFYDGDKITVKTEKDKVDETNTIVLKGFDPNVVIDSTNSNKESILDETQPTEDKNYQA